MNTKKALEQAAAVESSLLPKVSQGKKLTIETIEKIYGVHGRFATPEEMRTFIEKRRASELKVTMSVSQ